jgi:hypothetical protein
MALDTAGAIPVDGGYCASFLHFGGESRKEIDRRPF